MTEQAALVPTGELSWEVTENYKVECVTPASHIPDSQAMAPSRATIALEKPAGLPYSLIDVGLDKWQT